MLVKIVRHLSTARESNLDLMWNFQSKIVLKITIRAGGKKKIENKSIFFQETTLLSVEFFVLRGKIF